MRAKQRLCYHVVRQTLVGLVAVSPHVNSADLRVVGCRQTLPVGLARHGDPCPAGKRFDEDGEGLQRRVVRHLRKVLAAPLRSSYFNFFHGGSSLPTAVAAILFLLALPGGQRAVALDHQKALFQYNLRSWQTRDGLPQNTIQAVIQTRDGYIWVGTQEGWCVLTGCASRFSTDAIRR